jgi:hypothetical protein
MVSVVTGPIKSNLIGNIVGNSNRSIAVVRRASNVDPDIAAVYHRSGVIDFVAVQYMVASTGYPNATFPSIQQQVA